MFDRALNTLLQPGSEIFLNYRKLTMLAGSFAVVTFTIVNTYTCQLIYQPQQLLPDQSSFLRDNLSYHYNAQS